LAAKGRDGRLIFATVANRGHRKKRPKSKNANLEIGVPRWRSQDYLERIIRELPRLVKEKDGEKTSDS
jgi:hypothetical protein